MKYNLSTAPNLLEWLKLLSEEQIMEYTQYDEDDASRVKTQFSLYGLMKFQYLEDKVQIHMLVDFLERDIKKQIADHPVF